MSTTDRVKSAASSSSSRRRWAAYHSDRGTTDESPSAAATSELVPLRTSRQDYGADRISRLEEDERQREVEAAESRLRRLLRADADDTYRYRDPTATFVASPYRRAGAADPLLSSSRLGITHAELYRQLEEEKARTKDLEATRTRQVATIADLEAEINRLKLNGYEGSVGVRDENARLRREVVRLQDELDELRRAAAVTERVRLPEAVDWAARLDASERRVRMLEQQLMDETRRWDSERVRLLARLAEAERRWTMPVFYRTSPSPPPPPPLPLHFIPHLPLLPPTPRYVITQRDRVKQPWKYHHGPNSSSLNGNTAKQS